MSLDLDGCTTSALDERSHRLDVLRMPCVGGCRCTSTRTSSVVSSEDAVPVCSFPAREIELVHVFEIVRDRVVGHDPLPPSRLFWIGSPPHAAVAVVRTPANREARPLRTGSHAPR